MHVKAMVIFQNVTNVATDRYINTFHYQGTWANLPAAEAVLKPAITAFYNSPATTTGIGAAMPAYVSRTVQLRLYDMAEPIQRVPLISTFLIGAPQSGSYLPEECAVVCSFHGGPPVTPRKRGRVFLGPLSTWVLSSDPLRGVTVSAAFQQVVKNAAKAMADSEAGWVVYSPTDDVTRSVEGGFCDDAFDTLRKRGPRTTARQIWTAA